MKQIYLEMSPRICNQRSPNSASVATKSRLGQLYETRPNAAVCLKGEKKSRNTREYNFFSTIRLTRYPLTKELKNICTHHNSTVAKTGGEAK